MVVLGRGISVIVRKLVSEHVFYGEEWEITEASAVGRLDRIKRYRRWYLHLHSIITQGRHCDVSKGCG